MALPGPPGALWGLALLGFALAMGGAGELIRRTVARRVRLFRELEPIERGLLDVYLGGAALYAIAVLPPGWFYPPTVVAFLLVGIAGLVYAIARSHPRTTLARLLRSRGEWIPYGLVALASLVLFAVELTAIAGVGTGNTYDSSLLTLYTSLLLHHHTIPLTLAPILDQATAYPQGTTVWLAAAQTIFGLPAARTSLLVTPLFLSALPLGGFVLGRRLVGSASAGAAVALVFALAAPWTRGLVFGSNDFVVAAPLVFLLAGRAESWVQGAPIRRSDALAYGALAGYAAALSPIGTEWLFVLLPVYALAVRPRFAGGLRRWFTRWGLALAAALAWVTPSLYALLAFHAGGAGGTAPGGIGLGAWIGAVDPLLLGPTDQLLSAFPLLRAELLGLLLVGAAFLILNVRPDLLGPKIGRFLLVGGGVLAALLGASVLAEAGLTPFAQLAVIESPAEESILLFELYTLLAAVPVIAIFRYLAPRSSSAESSRESVRPMARAIGPEGRAVFALVAAVVVLLPGAAVTVGALPGQLHDTYLRYGNVSAADLDLLVWSAAHLPSNASVLVAPGSAAEFLPGYAPDLRIVEPMSSGYRLGPAEYWLVVGELTNATLDAAGVAAIHALGATEVAVTQRNSELFAPFALAPIEARGWTVLFQEGDAYLFAVGS